MIVLKFGGTSVADRDRVYVSSLLGAPIQKFGEESLELLIQGLRKRD